MNKGMCSSIGFGSHDQPVQLKLDWGCHRLCFQDRDWRGLVGSKDRPEASVLDHRELSSMFSGSLECALRVMPDWGRERKHRPYDHAVHRSCLVKRGPPG
jgi:hypothetical protein